MVGMKSFCDEMRKLAKREEAPVQQDGHMVELSPEDRGIAITLAKRGYKAGSRWMKTAIRHR